MAKKKTAAKPSPPKENGEVGRYITYAGTKIDLEALRKSHKAFFGPDGERLCLSGTGQAVTGKRSFFTMGGDARLYGYITKIKKGKADAEMKKKVKAVKDHPVILASPKLGPAMDEIRSQL